MYAQKDGMDTANHLFVDFSYDKNVCRHALSSYLIV